MTSTCRSLARLRCPFRRQSGRVGDAADNEAALSTLFDVVPLLHTASLLYRVQLKGGSQVA